MAKLTQKMLQLGAPTRVPGAYYVRNTKYGPVIQKWPKPRPKKKSPGALYAEEQWAYAASLASSPAPIQLEAAIAVAKGTMNVPRDFLTMSAYGTHTRFFFDNGTEWTRYRDVTVNAQYVLDQVTDEPLSVIWRNSVGWFGIQPTAAEQVLQFDGNTIAFRSVIPPPTPYDAGAGAPTLPYWADTNMYLIPPSVGGTAITSLALTANRIYFIPLIVPYNRTFTSIAISIPAGGSVAASNARLGIYLLDPIKGGPGAVALDAGSIATNVTGLRATPINQALARGVYFVALWTSAAITVRSLNNTFGLASCGASLGAASPAQCNWLIRTETFGGSFADQSANTQTTNTAATAMPIVGIR